MELLRDTFQVIPLDEQVLSQAIESDIPDFEDAIQYFSAVRSGAQCLITRNQAHFPQGQLAIQDPSDFLDAHFSE